jgi:hypothetical protein
MGTAPEWLVGLMPHGYQTRLGEIQRLTAELASMDRISWLLWQTGAPLRESLRDVFLALRYDVEVQPEESTYDVRIALDADRRLLIRAVRSEGTVAKKSPDLVAAFQTLSEVATDGDRVVLAGNNHCAMRPAERPQSDDIASDALDLLQRMGANFVTTPTLFAIWSLSLQEDVARARALVDKLHAQNVGVFRLPSPTVAPSNS